MKKYCLAANLFLLGWFFLDMTGVYFENSYLVTRSWQEDGIFFALFVLALAFFLLTEIIGKYILIVWQSLWLLTQFLSHEWYTIIGGGEEKLLYFDGSIKLFYSETRYIPDAYHIILHVLILLSLILTVIFTVRKKEYDERPAH